MIKARTAGLDGQDDGELDMGYHDPLLCLFFRSLTRETGFDWNYPPKSKPISCLEINLHAVAAPPFTRGEILFNAVVGKGEGWLQ